MKLRQAIKVIKNHYRTNYKVTTLNRAFTRYHRICQFAEEMFE